MTPRSQLTAEQDVKLVAIKELLDLGHVHIGVAATVYTRVRLRLQRDTIDLLGCALGRSSEAATEPDEGERITTSCSTRPLTLPSTTAVKT